MNLIKTAFGGIIIASFAAYSQFNGILRDIKTNMPIEYAIIKKNGSNTGVYSNENGAFNIKCKIRDTLIVLHMSYNSDTIPVVSLQSTTEIFLTSHENMLEEVIISKNYALELILGASKKLKNQRDNWWYGDNFTRAYNYKKNEPSELNELFSSVQLNSSGIFQVAIEKGRYALKKGLMNKLVRSPYELTGGFIVLTNPWNGNARYLLNDSSIVKYQLKLKDFSLIDNVKYANIIFSDKQKEGLITINTNTLSLKKIDINIKVNDKVAGVIIKGFSKYAVSMIEINDSTNLINSVIEDSFVEFEGFLAPKGMSNKFKLISLNTNFRKEKPIEFDNLKLKKMDEFKVESIQSRIDKSKYDELFWKNNDIIKSTKLDSVFIESFRNEKSKGSLKFKQ